MTDPRITEILRDFEVFDGIYKREQVDAAVELREEITPHLIGVLEQVLRDPGIYVENPDRFAHNYALILLGHFREQRAHKVIVDLFSLPTDLPYELFGDIVTEDLPSILFKTCGGSTELIRSMILNKNADEYCRSAAARAMVFAAADGIIPREEVLALFGSLFTGNEASDGSHFWSLLACSLCDLYPEGMTEVIEKAYEDGLISPWYIIRIEEFERTLEAGKEHAIEQTREEMRRRSPDNVHDNMSRWACFREKEPSFDHSDSSPDRPKPKPRAVTKAKRRKIRKKQRAARKKGRR